MSRTRRRSITKTLLTWAYLLTPLFAVADFAFGHNLRAAFLDDQPQWRWAYYAAAFALGLLMTFVPALVRPLAIVEAGLNVLLTALTIFTPYVEMIRAAAEDRDVPPFALPIMPLLISIGILMIGTIGALERSGRRSGQRLG